MSERKQQPTKAGSATFHKQAGEGEPFAQADSKNALSRQTFVRANHQGETANETA